MLQRNNTYKSYFSTNDTEVTGHINNDSVENSTNTLETLNNFEQSRAIKLSYHLNETNYEEILTFGSETQQQMKKFTTIMVNQVKKSETNRVRDILFQLSNQLEQIDPDALIEKEQGFFAKLFQKPKASLQEVMSTYNRMSKQIDRLSIQLSHYQQSLIQDYETLNNLYDENEAYFQELSVYIAACEHKINELKTKTLPTLEREQIQEPFAEDHVQALLNAIESLERRLFDLQLSRQVAIQMAPQIRLLQQTGQLLMEKIQSSILTTVPLWQSQIALVLNTNNQRKLANQQTQFDAVNHDLQRKTGAIGLAQQSIEKLKQTQTQLLDALEETKTIEEQTSQHQQEASQQLKNL